MKAKQRVAALALAFVLSISGANAGIPVIDPSQIASNIASHMEQIFQWMEQFEQMEAQIEEMQKQYEAITGARGMGSIPDNIKDKMKSIMSDPPNVEAYRAKYPKPVEGSPKYNAVYDIMAKGDARINALHDLMEERMDQVSSLMQKIDSAKDPAAKQDLMNRIASEQAAIQAASGLMSMAVQKQKAEVRYARVEASEEERCYLFKC